jgi:hypothetical protein
VAGEIDQPVELGDIDVEDRGGFGGGKAFHSRQQKGLARQRRDGFELAVDRGRAAAWSFRLEIDADGIP